MLICDHALVFSMVRVHQKEGLQISSTALFRSISERKTDTRSAECRFIQWNWNHSECFSWCRSELLWGNILYKLLGSDIYYKSVYSSSQILLVPCAMIYKFALYDFLIQQTDTITCILHVELNKTSFIIYHLSFKTTHSCLTLCLKVLKLLKVLNKKKRLFVLIFLKFLDFWKLWTKRNAPMDMNLQYHT